RDDGVHLTVAQGNEQHVLAADRVLVAIGLQANVENLGLDKVGVEVRRDTISVGDWGKTTAAGIYAVGDVTGAPMLAHRASHQGVACVQHIAGLRTGTQQVAAMPSCVYAHPHSAAVGLTE